MRRITIFCTVILLFSACNPTTESVTLSPNHWGEGELDKYLALDSRTYPDNPTAVGNKGAVTNTFHAAASRAGLQALQQGGSSVDAALTTAMTQVTLNAGSVTSFFGIMNMVHYDAATGEIVSMDATWNTVLGETNPMTIPGNPAGADLFRQREVSGRSAMIGGFMKGVDAAHKRYGKLPFEQLFQPSIYLAENGFELNERTADYFKRRDQNLRRLEETKKTLIKADGSGYEEGDLFKQPALAQTLNSVVAEGVDYMYTGDWAQKFINAVQVDGGKITMEDLKAYEVIWSDPIRAKYGEFEVATAGYPASGSTNLIEALNLSFAAGLDQLPHWSRNGEALNKISEITNAYMLSYIPQATREMIYAGINMSDSSRRLMSISEAVWERMKLGAKMISSGPKGPKHSDTVVAIDQWGNMTAIVHSINCVVWGNEAIVVDGVSISDAASFQQAQIAAAGPGNRLPSVIELGIISKQGKPIIPFASMSTGLHQQTVQSVFNIIGHDMTLDEAVNSPSIFLPTYDYTNPLASNYTARVMVDAFPDSVLDNSNLSYQEIPASERRYAQGLWIGIYRDPETGKLTAVSPPYATGRAIAY